MGLDWADVQFFRAFRGPLQRSAMSTAAVTRPAAAKPAMPRSTPGASPPRRAASGIGFPIYAERAENAELWDVEGRRYIDFAAGIAVLNTGHRHPRVIAAVQGAARALHPHLPTRSCPTRATSRWPSG